MTDLSQMISALQEIFLEVSKVREEIHAAMVEIRRLNNSTSLGSKDVGRDQTPEWEQSREEWLKEAASRSSKNLFKGT